MQLLNKLEYEGGIELPPKRPIKQGKEKIAITSRTEAPKIEITGTASEFEPLTLKAVRSHEEIKLWNEYVERYHILGYKRPFGAHQRYFILSGQGKPLGCILFSAAAWALEARDKWIGWNETERKKNLNLIVNNTRFLLFPWVRVKNLASKSLSLAVKQIRKDWKNRYNFQPVMLETFVDKEKYRGTCYRAANWILLGETAGRGRMDRYTKYLSTPKQIFVYPLVSDFKGHLCNEHTTGGELR